MLQIGAFAQNRAINGMRLGAPKLQNAVANFAYRLHNHANAWGAAIKIVQSPAIKTFASTAPLWQRT
jgi:hypothetical protein